MHADHMRRRAPWTVETGNDVRHAPAVGVVCSYMEAEFLQDGANNVVS